MNKAKTRKSGIKMQGWVERKNKGIKLKDKNPAYLHLYVYHIAKLLRSEPGDGVPVRNARSRCSDNGDD